MTRLTEWLLGLPVTEMVRADSWRLGFVADYGNYVKVALILAFMALVYLTIHSYRREGDAPTGAKVTLMCMRIATLALVFAIIFNPAVVLRDVKTLRSRVTKLDDTVSTLSDDVTQNSDDISSLETDLEELTDRVDQIAKAQEKDASGGE